MRFSGYIFDVEGTLVDSVPQNLLSLKDALAKFGVSASYALLQLYSGLDGDQTLQLVAPSLDVGERKKVLELQGKLYEANYLESVKAFPCVRDVFRSADAGRWPDCARDGLPRPGIEALPFSAERQRSDRCHGVRR
jgi:beta-phosphoglucomutase-like phosphatase (HAD superfamily)